MEYWGMERIEGMDDKLTMLNSEEKEAVLEFVSKVRKKLGSSVHSIILFGSKVRGEHGKESDIDILIVLKNLSWEIKRTISEMAAEENLKHNVLISTVRYDLKTWENPVIKETPFVKSVKKEGIWL